MSGKYYDPWPENGLLNITLTVRRQGDVYLVESTRQLYYEGDVTEYRAARATSLEDVALVATEMVRRIVTGEAEQKRRRRQGLVTERTAPPSPRPPGKERVLRLHLPKKGLPE